MKAARNFGIVALVALALTAAPGGGGTLNVVLAILGIVFFGAIAFLGYRLYREHHFTLDSLPDLDRTVLYSSVGLALLTFAAGPRLGANGLLGTLALVLLLGVASLGAFWVFTRYRRYN